MDPTKMKIPASTGDVEIPPKRRKTDPVPAGSSNVNTPFTDPQKNEMKDSCTSLHSAANKARVAEIRTVIHDLHCEERGILEEEAKKSTEEIAKLKLHISELEKSCQAAEKSSQEAKAALVAAEAQFSKIIVEKDQRIAELLHKNAKDTENLNAAKNRIIELRQDGISVAASRRQLELKETELEAAKKKIAELESEAKYLWEEVQDLLSKASSRKEGGEELQSVDNSSATPQEAVEKEKPIPKMISGDETVVAGNCEESPSGLVKDQLKDSEEGILHQQNAAFNHLKEPKVNAPKEGKLNCQEKCEDLKRKKEVIKANVKSGPKSSKRGSSVPVTDKDPKIMSKLDRSSFPKSGQQNQRIWTGNLYVLASNSKFFDIDWKTHYQKVSPDGYKCSKCDEVIISRANVEDHIWCVHYEGQFWCPLCPAASVGFSCRREITSHTKKVHPQIAKCGHSN